MTKQGKNGIIIGVSLLFLGVAGYFIVKAIRTTKGGNAKLKKDCESKGGTYVKGVCIPSNQGKVGNTDIITKTDDVKTDGTTTTTTTATTTTEAYVIPKSQSNLRSQPNVLASVVKKYTKGGEKALVTASQSVSGYTWYKVKDVASGLEGYLRSDVVTLA